VTLASGRAGQVEILSDVMVTMRDGVRLATDIYFPPDFAGRGPVLLERIPYGKTGTSHADRSLADREPLSKPQLARRFAEAGYVYILQDCRGRYGSEGDFTKYLMEGPDGYDTLAWLRAQPWCDGRVGTLGLSYGAHVQTALAGLAPEGLAAMFLDSGGFSSAYHSGIRQGGAFELKQLTWALKHARLSPRTAADPGRARALAEADIGSWVGVWPWTRGNSPLCSAPEYENFVLELLSRETFSDFWRQPALYGRGNYERFPDVPMVHMSSWYDPYALTAVENYLGLRGRREPVRLLMGPWTHGQRSVSHAGDVDFGPTAPLDGNIAPDYVALRRDFFDRYVRGLAAPDHLAAPVTLFVMGGGSGRRTPEGRLDHGGRWLRSADWPPPAARPVRLHLHSTGSLSPSLPEASAPLSWEADPLRPVPTIGGAIASGAPLMEPGAFDQREREGLFAAAAPGRALADRDDVLVFETEPLAEEVEVIGPVEAQLWVSSSNPDTDVTVKLVDVHPANSDYPEGYAMNLSHGILRLRFRNGYEVAEPLTPGTVVPVHIQAFPTANLFKKGHRIRVEVASSNFPHFDINPNSGAAAGIPSEPQVARNSIHFDPKQPSLILLHVTQGLPEVSYG
jgi:uncharacterized protein